MNRFHVHVYVDDLAAATKFYATLFGAGPSVEKPDYAKWMLDDPRLNFAISARGRDAGLSHLGIQVDDEAELGALHARLEAAGEAIAEKGAATCCYARSDKGWVRDPAGLSWETFFTRGASTVYGDGKAKEAAPSSACCGPAAEAKAAEAKAPAAEVKAPAADAARCGSAAAKDAAPAATAKAAVATKSAAACCAPRAAACPCAG